LPERGSTPRFSKGACEARSQDACSNKILV
jgi:hypothetical protein